MEKSKEMTPEDKMLEWLQKKYSIGFGIEKVIARECGEISKQLSERINELEELNEWLRKENERLKIKGECIIEDFDKQSNPANENSQLQSKLEEVRKENGRLKGKDDGQIRLAGDLYGKPPKTI